MSSSSLLRQPPLQAAASLAGPALTDAQAAQLEQVFKALADRHRVRILNLLVHAGEPVCVCDLVTVVGLKQPAVSYHLKQLADAGLVTRERRGTYAYYQLAPGALDQCATLLCGQPDRASPGP
jgi:ArsR family transcriptional regulator, arsenate/arsenite/antimonite-responsive transcriptional repressor